MNGVGFRRPRPFGLLDGNLSLTLNLMVLLNGGLDDFGGNRGNELHEDDGLLLILDDELLMF